VSDAGSPGIVRVHARAGAAAAGLPIVGPGPSSALCALEVSGLPTDRFAFEGFLPRRAGRRRARIEELRADPRTLIFFESPHRLIDAVNDLAEVLGDRSASISRELTKKFEETRRGTLRTLLAWLKEHPPRGEFVLVVAGAPRQGGDEDMEDIAE
jgi:16S rRNA (cytidine1402-2'-O)-methyltransferase